MTKNYRIVKCTSYVEAVNLAKVEREDFDNFAQHYWEEVEGVWKVFISKKED